MLKVQLLNETLEFSFVILLFQQINRMEKTSQGIIEKFIKLLMVINDIPVVVASYNRPLS